MNAANSNYITNYSRQKTETSWQNDLITIVVIVIDILIHILYGDSQFLNLDLKLFIHSRFSGFHWTLIRPAACAPKYSTK